jgi:hypothetical protein
MHGYGHFSGMYSEFCQRPADTLELVAQFERNVYFPAGLPVRRTEG